MLGNFERIAGNEKLRQSDNIAIEQRSRLNYDDVAMQENGEFTFLVGKKSQNGQTGGVALIRGMGFYTAGPAPKEMRINDFIPVEPPEPSDLPQNRQSRQVFVDSLKDGSFARRVRAVVKGDPVFARMHSAFEHNYADPDRPLLGRLDTSFAVLGAYLTGELKKPTAPAPLPQKQVPETVPAAPAVAVQENPAGPAAIQASLMAVADLIVGNMTAPVAPAVAAAEAPALDDEWARELAIVMPQQLLDMQVMAAGEGFASLSDKWAAEERIKEVCDVIARETAYHVSPEPEPQDVAGMRKRLSDLQAQCRAMMKDRPGE